MNFKFYFSLLLAILFALSSFYNHSSHLSTAPNKGGEVLKQGEKVPRFVTKDVLGNKVHLKKVLKDSKVLLTFLRPAWCPICNARTHELRENYEAMKAKGFEIIAVYPSTENELKGYVKDLDIPFVVIADPEEELYRLYGVERSKEKFNQTLKEDKALEAIKKGKELYEKNGNDYGGLREVEEPIIPADFVLVGDNVQQVHYGDFIGDHIAIKTLQAVGNNTTKARF